MRAKYGLGVVHNRPDCRPAIDPDCGRDRIGMLSVGPTVARNRLDCGKIRVENPSVGPTDGRPLYFVKVVLAIEEPLPIIGPIVGHNRPD